MASLEEEEELRIPGFLATADARVAQEFGVIALERVMTGKSGMRGFGKAAKVLQISVEEVEQGVASLTTVLARCVRYYLPRSQQLLLLTDAGLQEVAREALADLLTERQEELYGEILSSVASYRNLNWRLDIQVASRSLQQQSRPSYLLALATSNGVKHMEADFSVLKEVCAQLEAALAESRSAYSRRFQRFNK
ncbi:unnamed protein product [Sphagnum troendelagicum]